MMYAVTWTKSASAELAAAWLEADSTAREAITTAASRIDDMLKSGAGEFGESRSENRRIGFVPPLGIAFSVDDVQQRAKVLHVWTI